MPVYMIRAGEDGPVKIGHSRDPQVRLAQLQISHWERLRLIRMFKGGAAEEATLHLRFADLSIRGEWHHFSRAMLGDVGLVEATVPPRVPKPQMINPLTGKVGKPWTAEERAAASARQLAISADPARREARRAKLRTTFERKRAEAANARGLAA